MAERPADRPSPTPRPRPDSRPGPSGAGGSGIGNVPTWAIVAAAIVVAVLVWLLFIKGDDDNSDNASNVSKSVKLYSASELPGAVAGVGYPVYWLGPEPNTSYELTLISDGRTYVRYLPPGEPAQSGNQYTTVGSYQRTDSVGVLKDLAKNPGAKTFSVPGGGLALKQQDLPTSVYVAYPGANTQIEVYDPKPGRAERLVKQSELLPLG
jgi:hypothetical protein